MMLSPAVKRMPKPAVVAPTVLVVDDEPLIRWSVGERLRDEGYDVLEAATGREAIEHCQKCVDPVLLDSKLPDLGGRPEAFAKRRPQEKR